MSDPVRFILVDGMDNCGKSSLLQRIEAKYPEARPLRFKKTLPSGALLRMNTEKDFEILFSAFEHFDPRNVYLLDRFIPSNIVYDFVLRGEDTSLSKYYLTEFRQRFRVLELYLTRPLIRDDFKDDRIFMTKGQFNRALELYHQFGPNRQLLIRDGNDQPHSVDEAVQAEIDEVIDRFITF